MCTLYSVYFINVTHFIIIMLLPHVYTDTCIVWHVLVISQFTCAIAILYNTFYISLAYVMPCKNVKCYSLDFTYT